MIDRAALRGEEDEIAFLQIALADRLACVLLISRAPFEIDAVFCEDILGERGAVEDQFARIARPVIVGDFPMRLFAKVIWSALALMLGTLTEPPLLPLLPPEVPMEM